MIGEDSMPDNIHPLDERWWLPLMTLDFPSA
jgi:hypothetical protein